VNEYSTLPRQRPPSPIERVFPEVARQARVDGDEEAAAYAEQFPQQLSAWRDAERARITYELDHFGSLPAAVPAWRSPEMGRRYEAALRSTPLRNAPGVAGRDPLGWGQA
jgi:hypothetical protein